MESTQGEVSVEGKSNVVTAKLSRSSAPRAALQLQEVLTSGEGRPLRAPHHR
jgi:hypothetical protein